MNVDELPEGLTDLRGRTFLLAPPGCVAFAVDDVLAAAGADGLAYLRAHGAQDALLDMPVSRGLRPGRVMAPLPRPPLAVIYIPRDALPDSAMAGPPR